MTPRKRPAIEKDPLYRNDHASSLMKVDAEPLSCVKYHMECYFTPVTKGHVSPCSSETADTALRKQATLQRGGRGLSGGGSAGH